MASSCFTRRARASRTARRARARVREAPSWTWPSASRETASRCSSSFGGGATRRAAVRGASAARRARSPATIRAAASAPPSRASAAPSSALPGTPSSSRAAVISGTGAARMAWGSVAAERRVTRAARSGPAACAPTRSNAAGNSSVSSTEGATPPPTVIRRPPAPRGRSGSPACRPPLELGHHLSHDLSEILRPTGNRLPHGAPDLVGVHCGGQELLERLHLGELRLGPVGTASGGVLLGRFAAALDTATHDLGRLFIRHGVLELE